MKAAKLAFTIKNDVKSWKGILGIICIFLSLVCR